MKSWKGILGALLLSSVTAGCSSAYYATSGVSGDDLYGTHDRLAIARREKAEAELAKAQAEAQQAQWEALMAQADAAEAEARYNGSNDTNPYEGLVADTYESAYARRLRGFESPTYSLPASYWNLRFSGKFDYLTAYSPAFYNIIVMGDEAWVEPKYITSMFGSWGLSSSFSMGYMAGLYDSWYWDWGYGWGYDPWYRPYWSWGWHNPWYYDYYWGWGWGYPHHWGPHGPHHPHYYYPSYGYSRPNYRLSGGNGYLPRDNAGNFRGGSGSSRYYGNYRTDSRGNSQSITPSRGNVTYHYGGRTNSNSGVYQPSRPSTSNDYSRPTTTPTRPTTTPSFDSGRGSSSGSFGGGRGGSSGGSFGGSRGGSSSGSSQGYRGR